MPRIARRKSATGVYHVILRGVNQQRIFEENEDYKKFIQTVTKYKKVCGYIIYGYCLMSNHVHLLMKEEAEDLGNSFRRIGASYVQWYNLKYNRSGSLFQGRYKSEAVETDAYFFTVLRYIHQNPVKAGMVNQVSSYPWSSYGEYIKDKEPHLCDIKYPLSMFAKDPNSVFISFHGEENQDQCLDYEVSIRVNDSKATELVKSTAKIDSPQELQGFDMTKRNQIIKILRAAGVSIRQLQRLTGISFGVISRIK